MECAVKKVITLNMSVNTSDIVIYNNNRESVNDRCRWSWSSDGVCWTNWSDFITFETSVKSSETDFYVRALCSQGVSGVAIEGVLTECYTTCIHSEAPFTADLCANSRLFDPYAGVDCTLQMFQQISDSIICMFGIPCYYFRVTPDLDSADYTFKEYALHSVTSVKKIKLMLEEGAMPSSMPQMTEFDFDWDNDWTVEVGKSDFARSFGDTAHPKQRDLVYVPLMKRMYEVNSAYDEKQNGFMWRSTTWKLGLVKYNDKSNVDTEDFDSIIDEFIVNTYDDIFGEREAEERRRESAVDQAASPKYAADNLYRVALEDSVRYAVTMTELENIDTVQINNESIIIARNMYNFKDSESVIEYINEYCGECGALSVILTMPKDNSLSKDIVSIGDIALRIDGMRIVFDSMSFEAEPSATYLVMCRWSRDLFTAELDIMKMVARQGVPKYMLKPEHHKFESVHSSACSYSDIYICPNKTNIKASPFPVKLTNIKVLEGSVSSEELFKESMKYTTNSEKCLINDCARPLSGRQGFSVR